MASDERAHLRFSWPMWLRLIAGLRRRGGGVRESGAFILGRRSAGRANVHGFSYYDDIDPASLETGIVRLSGAAMNAVWQACEDRGLEVLADVHTHPAGTMQSASDRDHPMVATRGHLALIIPDFARRSLNLKGVGHYRYLGGKQWRTLPAPKAGLLHVHCRSEP